MTIDNLKNKLNPTFSDLKLAATYQPLTIDYIEFALSNTGDFMLKQVVDFSIKWEINNNPSLTPELKMLATLMGLL